MTISEILKAKGIGDDVIKAVLDEMKANKIFTASEENLDVRYGKLKGDHETATKSLEEANATIKQLQEAAQGQDNLQQIIKDHEQKEAQLQAELKEAQIDAAIKVGLLSAKAKDLDFLAFTLRKKGEIELDENGEIKGWEDKVAALKTQHPMHFEAAAEKKYEENPLPKSDENRDTEPETLESALRMQYENNN